MTSAPTRCKWVASDPLYREYHDNEWGVPSRDDRHLFEMLVLEGAQAGLSWRTILNKRDGYRSAFADFDPMRIARFGARDVARLQRDAGIVRNRLKIEATIANARACLEAIEQLGSFATLVWSFVDNTPVTNHWRRLEDVPSETSVSRAMSRELRQRGFRFVGPTICYAYMQAVGMVNDHTTDCFRHRELAGGSIAPR